MWLNAKQKLYIVKNFPFVANVSTVVNVVQDLISNKFENIKLNTFQKWLWENKCCKNAKTMLFGFDHKVLDTSVMIAKITWRY